MLIEQIIEFELRWPGPCTVQLLREGGYGREAVPLHTTAGAPHFGLHWIRFWNITLDKTTGSNGKRNNSIQT